ncbi:MAG: hypothetical protein JWP31_1665 [Aeromicrobium sp.]|nr:hypothetical protein [Aeromicrobium sp.]
MNDVRSALFPVVAGVLVLLASLVPGDEPSPRPPSTVDVTQAAYACPAGSVISVTSGQVAAGSASTSAVLPGGAPDDALAGAGRWRTAVVDGEGVVVQQQGRASGPVGYFAGTAPKAGGGGLVVGGCPGIVDDAWLLGLGSGDKHFSTLILTNLGESPAVVDVALWGPQGPIDAVNADGIVIEPSSVRRIRLDALAAGESELAVHVVRRRGSVSAIANDMSTATYRGTEPVSTTLTPRREQVVGGLVKGTAGRTLMLLNPGTSTARVDVEVVGRSSTFTPSGLEQIKVKAGALRLVAMPRSVGGAEAALRVTSDRPVAATLRLAPDVQDYAYAEASRPLAGPTVVPLDLGVGTDAPRLVLTAPGRTATVELETFDADMGSVSTRSVTIAGGTTRSVQLSGRRAAYVVLRPQGDVVATATYVKGDGISSLALLPAPLTVQGPQVRPVG